MNPRKYGNVVNWRAWGLVVLILVIGLVLILSALFRPERPPSGASEREGEEGQPVVVRERTSDGVSEPSSRDVSGVSAEERIVSEDVSLEDHRPQVALLIDDFGYSLPLARRLARLDLPMTWAILPYLRYTHPVASLAEERGIPFFLHLPMQARVDGDEGPFLVGTSMDTEVIRDAVVRAARSLPGLSGVNNHRGSKATSDERTMTAVLDVIADEGLAFVDSRTSSESLAFDLARERHIPSLFNRLFLDNEADVELMKEKMAWLVNLARSDGWGLAICHVRPETVAFLEILASNPPEEVRFVTVPELISDYGSR